MKKSLILLYVLLFFCTLSCTKEVTDENLHYLNGYWEIETVTGPEGQRKDFKPTTTIDYITFENGKGYRKKVQPTLSGTYKTSNDADFFTIDKKEDIYTISYKSKITEWTETLTKVSENNFAVKSDSGNTYFYKRYEPLNLE